MIEDKGTQRRREILDAALRCFAAEGYHGTTNRKIASVAGITEGLIYHYFPSKKALLLELIRSRFQDDSACDLVFPRWEPRFKDETLTVNDLSVFLFELGQASLASMDRNIDLMRTIVSEYRIFTEEGEPLYPKLVLELKINRMAGILSLWKERYNLPIADPVIAVHFFMGPLYSFFHFQEILSGKKIMPINRTTFLESLIPHFLKGIGFSIPPMKSTPQEGILREN